MGTTYVYEPVDRLDPENWEYTNITIVDEGPGNIVGRFKQHRLCQEMKGFYLHGRVKELLLRHTRASLV